MFQQKRFRFEDNAFNEAKLLENAKIDMREENFINKFLMDNNRDYCQTIQLYMLLDFHFLVFQLTRD